MITYICLKSSRANKDHPRNGPLMVSNNVPMKEYDSMLSPNWGEIRALALYEMTRGPNETPRHLIFAFLLLILFIHSRGKWKFTRWFPKKNTSIDSIIYFHLLRLCSNLLPKKAFCWAARAFSQQSLPPALKVLAKKVLGLPTTCCPLRLASSLENAFKPFHHLNS